MQTYALYSTTMELGIRHHIKTDLRTRVVIYFELYIIVCANIYIYIYIQKKITFYNNYSEIIWQ